MTRCSKIITVLTFTPVLLAPVVPALLPERIPTHWNLAGQADGWGSPLGLLLFFQGLLLVCAAAHLFQLRLLRDKPDFAAVGERLMAGIMGFVALLMLSAFALACRVSHFGPPAPGTVSVLLMGLNLAFLFVLWWYTPRMFPGQAGNAAVTRQILLGIGLFFTFLVVAGSLSLFGGRVLRGSGVVLAGTGLLFMVIGNLLPKLKSNPWSGIRVKWTLADPENWYLTHRFAGRIWIAGGAMLALCALLLPPAAMKIVTAADLIFLVLVPIWYSWRLARKKKL